MHGMNQCEVMNTGSLQGHLNRKCLCLIKRSIHCYYAQLLCYKFHDLMRVNLYLLTYLSLDYEITPLPKQSDIIEVAKFTSVAYSEEDRDISMSNDVPKEGEDTSNSSSSDDFKATQPGMEKCGRSSVPRE